MWSGASRSPSQSRTSEVYQSFRTVRGTFGRWVFAFVSGVIQGSTLEIESDGRLGWKREFGTAGEDASATSLIRTVDGDFLIGAQVGENGWLIKVDASGAPLWQKRYGNARYPASRGTRINAVAETADGCIIAVGQARSAEYLQESVL